MLGGVRVWLGLLRDGDGRNPEAAPLFLGEFGQEAPGLFLEESIEGAAVPLQDEGLV
ncbi:hypothetical protein M878_05365 [Streptomyces roseochromogenus subsp. oscitans DS 12.976]|uniref:Uncharacterized protein n=1 Tax=Streptomyces roseochromogenus subsp. oscitans DS 12.976 TaxID=1352936 RepID=V6KTG5_STRRC|nr:hypothetical protein M878_05365 [Streptomyces roseochromogenus subsp. oscitans DS 12.976]